MDEETRKSYIDAITRYTELIEELEADGEPELVQNIQECIQDLKN